jgi:hypothetical protein
MVVSVAKKRRRTSHNSPVLLDKKLQMLPLMESTIYGAENQLHGKQVELGTLGGFPMA